MNQREYHLYLDGRQAAAGGAGLSDSPHGGIDGDLWRSGVRSWLDDHGNEGGAARSVDLQDRTGGEFWISGDLVRLDQDTGGRVGK